ncbi:flagellar biosynthetic protein FliQ [Syntrophobotulus glycolicus DSM 8271]|uniref:Flagellar biosynthetic protein FliQ n=1 Tax=Syntrophobotulus glycolicus (strain DSM 8271 / FlGlyR) TaxID=645991 RepID=F0SZV9_SYNGF|nr:flagellar biosynthesis protein FliQ [Syntrophobotulus glycolicus]ADY54970.1 flagellar biosynthetic protein FliQ [Syntrophobotulus glycolicus DSM 8271]
MTQNQIIFMAKEAMWTVLLVGGPLLALSLLIGLVVSIFQAMTQIQEQTLSFIPKLVVIAVALLLLGPWMLNIMTSYTVNIFHNLVTYARY